MIDRDKSKHQLIDELAELRRRVAALEESLTRQQERAERLQQSEEALRESEERYRLLAESIPHPVWRSDAEGRQIDCNRRWQEYTGQTPEEAQGNGWMKALHPDDVAWAIQRVREDVPGGSVYQAEYRLRRASDNSYHWHLAKAIPRRDADGTVLGWFGCATDIERQKQVEEALRLSEAKYRRLHQSMMDAFVRVDMDGFFQEYNEVFLTMLGYEPDELRKLRYMDVTPDKWNAHVAEIVQNQIVSRGYSDVYEKEYRRKDGTAVPIEMRVSLITDDKNQPCGMWAIVRDITERKRAEEALQKAHDELEQRVKERTAELAKARDELRAIYEGMFDGLLVAEIETKRFVSANAAMARMLGYSEAELLSLSVKDIHPQADLPFVMKQFNGLAEGKIQVSDDIPVLRKDGSVFLAVVTTSKVARDDRPCVVGFFRDVTQRKRAEEALRKEHRNLKRLLHASDHERQLIAYEIHDELAQQLAGAIMQFQVCEHLQEKSPREAAKAYDAAMTMLQQGHFEARRLIAGVRPPILDESGVVEAVAHLVHEVGRETGPKIENRSRVDFDRLDPTLENAIYRIAQEALTNACRHGKSEKVRVSLLQRGDRLRIEIRDWGVGFDPKAIPKSHFGLEGIRQRARLLGGKCKIRSAEGKGTRITVTLPVVLRDDEE